MKATGGAALRQGHPVAEPGLAGRGRPLLSCATTRGAEAVGGAATANDQFCTSQLHRPDSRGASRTIQRRHPGWQRGYCWSLSATQHRDSSSCLWDGSCAGDGDHARRSVDDARRRPARNPAEASPSSRAGARPRSTRCVEAQGAAVNTVEVRRGSGPSSHVRCLACPLGATPTQVAAPIVQASPTSYLLTAVTLQSIFPCSRLKTSAAANRNTRAAQDLVVADAQANVQGPLGEQRTMDVGTHPSRGLRFPRRAGASILGPSAIPVLADKDLPLAHAVGPRKISVARIRCHPALMPPATARRSRCSCFGAGAKDRAQVPAVLPARTAERGGPNGRDRGC